MAKDYMPWIIGGALGVGALYLLSQQQPPVTSTAQPPQVTVTGPSDFIGMGTPGGTTQTLLQMASQQLGLPQSELVVRGLIPQDLGLITFSITAAGAGWTSVCNTATPDNTFISLEGCSYGGTVFSQLRIQAGSRYVEYWPLTFISGLQNQLWYDDSPSVAQQNQPIIIDAYASGAGTENINIMGTVVEKRGITIA